MIDELFPIKPQLDQDGNIIFPENIKLPREAPLELDIREWLVLFFLALDKSRCTNKKVIRSWELFYCGSLPTKYRIIKQLKEKGLLKGRRYY